VVEKVQYINIILDTLHLTRKRDSNSTELTVYVVIRPVVTTDKVTSV
jgi:hypothetical protein